MRIDIVSNRQYNSPSMNVGLDGKPVSVNENTQPFAGKVGKRRSNIQIIADMLRVGENGAGKTEIMYTANMSYSQIQKYLDYLVNQGFINKVSMDNTMVAYQVTDNGLQLLKAIDTLMNMLEPARQEGV
jgi:predicted transcriptional regulator